MHPTTKDNENILLIIDDEDDIRILIKTIFSKDYTIIEAEDGQEGLAKANEYIPDIIISDVMMPNIDGFAFCELIKSNEKTSHIPIILLTAKTDYESKLQGLNLGATDYITKPFMINELKSKVNNLIALQKNVMKFLTSKVFGSSLTTDANKDNRSNEFTNQKFEKTNLIESEFLAKVYDVVERNYANQNFDVVFFAKALFISSVQLRRKLRVITNLTVVEFIRNYRLNIAKNLIKASDKTISEIAYEVGFDSISYFSRVFQEQFSQSPTSYRSEIS